MISFDPLRREDFALVASWLAEPLVARWWNDDSSPAGVEQQFGPVVDGGEPTDVFVALDDGRPFGLIQRYAIASYPEFVTELTPLCEVPAGALSIDYFVGDPQLRGRGIGTAMIVGLVDRTWAEQPTASCVIVPIAAANVASWRTLERAGFRRIAQGDMTPDNPVDPPDHVIYRLDRP